MEKEAQVNPSREKRHLLNAKSFKQKTDGTVFKGKQTEVLGKVSIWLISLKKKKNLFVLFAGQ